MATPVLQIVAVSVLSLIAFTPTGCGALLIRALRVPGWAQLHHPAVLSCQYDAQGELLYSVKWYRNRQEFYRYLKEEAPNIRTFPMTGVHVDVARSNDTTLTLSDVSFDTAGEYTCEVSVDAPTFLTAVSSARLNVVALPPKGPHISGLNDAYVPGQTIVANCTVGPAIPRATLRWSLNGVELDPRNLVAPAHGAEPPARSAAPNWLALRLPVETEIFKGRQAELRCHSAVGELPSGDASFTAILSDARPGNERLAQYSGAAPAASTGLLALCASLLWLPRLQSLLAH